MTDAQMYVAAVTIVALVILACWGYAAIRDDRRLHELPEVTPVAPPTLLPANRALVVVLRTVAEDIEQSGQRVAASLRDIARVIQISAVEPVPDPLRERIAGFVDDHGAVFPRSAQRIRGGI